MNTGAGVARGEWLLFLHADTLLPDGALEAIAALPDDIQAGGFRHRFSGDDWRLRLISWMHNVRCRWTHVFYGDQALFVRRALFERLGGFPEQALMEDVAFCEKLVHATRPRLLQTCVVTDAQIHADGRLEKSRARSADPHLPRAAPAHPARGFFRDVR